MVTLREFKYFDRQIVEDFLSIIEGGLATETKVSSINRSGQIGAEAGIGVLKIKGDRGTRDISNEETKRLGDAALFQRLYDALISNKMIGEYSTNAEKPSLPKQGDILEIEGSLQLPFFDTTVDVFKQFLPLMPQTTIDQKGLAMIGLLSTSETVNVKIVTETSTESLIVVLQTRNLRIPKNELADSFTTLCRVKRVLKEKETYDILKLPVRLNKKVIDEFLKSFSNMPDDTIALLGRKPTEDDLQIHHPALILTPIAIYQ